MEGRQPTGPGLANAPISIHAHGGQTVTGKTVSHGIARFTLAPGTYTAQLINVVGDSENAHAGTYCPEGAPPATVTMTTHGAVQATLLCWLIG